jgi:hypothetical protein
VSGGPLRLLESNDPRNINRNKVDYLYIPISLDIACFHQPARRKLPRLASRHCQPIPAVIGENEIIPNSVRIGYS